MISRYYLYRRLQFLLLQLIDVNIVADVPDPCRGVSCGFGELCRPTADAKSYHCECPTSCPSYGDHEGSRPLCGSDARDYPGECEMRRAACETNTNITFKYFGKCGMYYMFLQQLVHFENTLSIVSSQRKVLPSLNIINTALHFCGHMQKSIFFRVILYPN